MSVVHAQGGRLQNERARPPAPAHLGHLSGDGGCDEDDAVESLQFLRLKATVRTRSPTERVL
jgi:hypothetical protein